MKKLLAIIIFPILFLSSGHSFAEVETFYYPKYKGSVLNMCYKWGRQCRAKPANEWCKWKGYERARSWSIIDRKQLNRPTRVMGSGAVCDAGACSGFHYITCSKSQTFYYPKYKGSILNMCYKWGQQCRAKPANKWCKWKGYERARSWSIIDRKQLNKPTRVMGSGAVCDAGACSGFRYITCE